MGSLQFCDWCKHDTKNDGYNKVESDLQGKPEHDYHDYVCNRCADKFKVFRKSVISDIVPQICYKEKDDEN